MIYEMESKSQNLEEETEQRRDEETPRKRKKGKTFPSSRRRSYNKTIVFHANGARSNKGACKSEGIPQNNISQCPTDVDDVDSLG